MEIKKMKITEIKAAAYNPRKKLKVGDPEYEKLKKVQIDKEKIQTEYYRHYRKRVAMQKEFNPEIESKTCLSCGRCRDCGMCKEACPTGAIVRKNVGDGE